MTRTTLIAGLVAITGSILAAQPDLTKLPAPATQKGVTYAKDIRPILETSCFRCHGEERPKGGLRLDSLEAVLKGGDDGKVVITGKSEKSPLVVAVARIDPETAMPPMRGGGGGGPGGPGGPGGFGGGPGGFGWGMFLAPQMVSQGDKNGDKKLSKDELTALADAWFDKLDTEKAGKLSQEQFTERLESVLPPPQRGGGSPGGGQQRGGGGGFNSAKLMGPGLFTATDTDKNGSLTRVELKNTFAKWFAEWDSEKSGALNEDKLRAGLNAALPRPSFGGPGGPGGFAGGPGTPGGSGGPGGQRNFQPGGPGGTGAGGPPGGGFQGGPGGPGGPGGQRPTGGKDSKSAQFPGGPGGGGFGPAPKALTPEQVGLIRAWIDQGAK